MSGITVALSIVSLAVGIATSVLQVVVEAVLLPFRILTELALVLLSLFPFIQTIIENRRVAIIVLVVTAVTLALGFVALFQSNVILGAIDVVFECFVAPVYEIVYKFAVNNIKGLVQIIGGAYNVILTYIVARGRLWVMETADVVQCVLDTGNILQLLELPAILWEFLYSMLFVLTKEARMSRRFIFNSPRFFYFTQDPPFNFTFTEPISPTAGNDIGFPGPTLEFPAGFGAFGPPEDVVPGNSASVVRLIFRSLYVDLANIVGTSGRLIFQIAGDLQRPAQKFGQNLIKRAEAPPSYFGQAADVVSRVVSLAGFTWTYPLSNAAPSRGSAVGAGAAGYSELRFKVEAIITKVLRIIGNVLRFVWLIINDVLTVNRPAELDPFCNEIDFSNPNELLALFQGFPVVDLFIVAFGVGTGNNLNIFRSNWEFCRLKMIQYQFPDTVAEFGTPVEPVDEIGQNYLNQAEVFQRHAELCGFLTKDSFSSGSVGFDYRGSLSFSFFIKNDFAQSGNQGWQQACNRWDGIQNIVFANRIDYIGEIFIIIDDIIEVFINPFNENTPAITKEVQEAKTTASITECFVDRLVNSIVYAVDVVSATATNPSICEPYPFTYVYSLGLEPCIVRILEEVAFEPKRIFGTFESSLCNDFILCNEDERTSQCAANKGNWVFCLVAKLSFEENSLFETLCGFMTFEVPLLTDPLQKLRCAPALRKRAAPTLEERRENMQISYTTHTLLQTQLFSMKLASELRQNSHVFDACIAADDSVLANCTTECAMAPCVDAIVDCIGHRVPEDSMLHWASAEHADATKRIASFVALAVDFVYGCEDSQLSGYLRWSDGVLTWARDFFARFATFAFDYTAAYSECMTMADKMRRAGNTTAETELAYLRCIGAPVPGDHPGAPVNTTREYFAESLRTAGIDDETTCGVVLHKTGFAVDTKPAGEASGVVFDAVYRTCAFMHAFGARATRSGYAASELADFMHPWRAPLAITSATANMPVNEADGILGLPAKPDSILQLAVPRAKAVGRPVWGPKNQTSALVRSIQGSFGAYATLVALGGYLADLQDNVLDQADHMTIEEMDHREQSMRRAAAAEIINVNMDPKAAQQRFESELRKAEPAHGRGHSHSLGGTFSALRRSMAWESTTEGGVKYDVAVKFRNTHGSVQAFLVNLHNPNATAARLSHHQHVPVSYRNIEAIVTGTAALVTGQSSLHQMAATAQSQLAHLHGDSIFRTGAAVEKALRASKVVLGTAFRIVNRRLRLHALPPVQAAVMSLDVLTNSRPADLEAWSRNQMGYIIGEGFVPIDDYDLYMAEEQRERERWLNLYSLNLAEDEMNSAALVSHRWAANRRLENERARRHALPRPKERLWDIWYRPNARRHGFARRAQFLVKHNLAHADEHLHHRVPLNWQYRSAALRANSSSERARILGLASAGSDDFLLEALQSLLDAIDPSFVIEDLLADFEAFGVQLWATVVDFFENFLEDGGTFDDILESAQCPGPGAYEAGGADQYALGCIPYFPERILDFWESFPRSPSLNKGFYGYFEGPGYIEWPGEMIVTDCAFDRDLVATCGGEDPPPFLWSAYTENGPGDRPQFNSTNFGLSVCLTDECAGKPPSAYPLCPFCDYCVREYQSASEFGFSTGFDVLLVWFSVIRGWVGLIFSNDIDFLYFLILFPAFALSDFSPFGPGITLFFTLAIPLADTIWFQRPERLLFPLFPMYLVHEFLPLVGWGVWLFSLWPTLSSGFQGVPFDTAPALDFINNFLLPDALVLQLLQLIRGSSFIASALSFLQLGVDLTSLDPTIMRLESNITAVASLASVIYSLLAVILVPITLAIVGLGVVLLFYALRILSPVLRFLGVIVRELFAIYTRVRQFRFRQRVRILRREVSELQDDQEQDASRARQQLRELEDEAVEDQQRDAQQDRRLEDIEDQLGRMKEE